MPDNGYSIIKPVESLQNVEGLTPTKRRKERKHRQNPHKQNEEKYKQEPNESTVEDINDETTKNEGDQHSVDYRA